MGRINRLVSLKAFPPIAGLVMIRTGQGSLRQLQSFNLSVLARSMSGLATVRKVAVFFATDQTNQDVSLL